MTEKTKAFLAGFIASITGFIAWLATVPPEVQSGFLSQLVELTPPEHRASVGLWARFFTLFSTIYMAYSAARSGPQTPPQNPPK